MKATISSIYGDKLSLEQEIQKGDTFVISHSPQFDPQFGSLHFLFSRQYPSQQEVQKNENESFEVESSL